MTLSTLKLSERAERMLCLAHAFLPPQSGSVGEAICQHLAQDLNELNQALQSKTNQVDVLSSVLSTLEHAEQLTRIYSRLFLAPPAPALPNLGFYLDSAMMGKTCQEIERLYLKYDLERDAHFKDAADHVALYLQFVGWIMARAEDQSLGDDPDASLATMLDLLQTLTHHAIPSLTRLHEQLCKAESTLSLSAVYGHLARLALDAAIEDAQALHAHLPARPALEPVATQSEPTAAADNTADSTPIACHSCGSAFVAEDGLAKMISLLAAQGLDTAHMRICPKCRASDMGMTELKIPTLKKAS